MDELIDGGLYEQELQYMEDNKIHVNIWDDYYDDGYIPEGKKQETYVYVEEYFEITHDDKKEILEFLMSFLNNLDLGTEFPGNNLKMWLFFYDSKDKYPTLEEHMHFKRWELRIENMTHKMREYLLETYFDVYLPFKNKFLDIYSES